MKTSIWITLLAIILKLFGVYSSKGVYYFAYVVVAEAFLTIAAFLFLKNKYKLKFIDFSSIDIVYVKRLLIESMPLMIAGLAII